jgi:vacuolar protein sorting-associated protein 35
MKNSIDRNDMRQVLKYSVDIINVLKTEFKAPSYYNQLFLNVYESLLPLNIYFKEEIKRGRRIKEFYEAVQQCITVLPRLYLMIIVGNIYIENCPSEKKEILNEIMRMANGVQHPLRGFYVRYFIIKILKNNFDDIESILVNIKEMNKLWIRIGHMKHILGKSDVMKVRNELKDLIGDNLIKLANVQDINDNIYKNKILLPLLKIIIESGDYISQQYLLLYIIDSFPDEYNIKSIDIIITSLSQMSDKIEIKDIFIKIMEKLGNFDSAEKLKNIKSNEIFEKLNGSIEKIIEEFQNQGDGDNDILKIIELEVSYLKFVINFGNFEEQNIKIKNINKIITKCYDLISKACDGRDLSGEGIKIIFNLLQIILDSPLSIFKCKNFPDLMNFLDDNYRSKISLNILDSLVNQYNIGMIDSKEKMESIIEFIKPMVYINDYNQSEYLLDKALNKICKLVFVPCSKDPYEQLEMLQMLNSLLLSTTKENEENLKNKKIVLYCTNYINSLLLIGYSLNEAYLNAVNNENEENNNKNNNKESEIHKDFCKKYNIDKFDKNNIEKYWEFYQLLIKEIDNGLSKLKNISVEIAYKLYLQCILLINKIGFYLNNNNKDKENKDKYQECILIYINKVLSMFTEGEINAKNKLELLIDFIGNIGSLCILSKENLIQI